LKKTIFVIVKPEFQVQHVQNGANTSKPGLKLFWKFH